MKVVQNIIHLSTVPNQAHDAHAVEIIVLLLTPLLLQQNSVYAKEVDVVVVVLQKLLLSWTL